MTADMISEKLCSFQATIDEETSRILKSVPMPK
jgi:hypothetical protein